MSFPPRAIRRAVAFEPEPSRPLTTTPGCIVRVIPDTTVIRPSSIYILPVSHVVFTSILFGTETDGTGITSSTAVATPVLSLSSVMVITTAPAPVCLWAVNVTTTLPEVDPAAGAVFTTASPFVTTRAADL